MARAMKDSGIEWIGEIPEAWETVRFKYLHTGLNTGEAIDKEYWTANEGDNPFYTAGLVPIRTTYADFPQWKYTSENDLLLARNGTPYVYFPVVGACYTDHIIRATLRAGLNRRFIQYGLQQSISSIVVDSVSIATWSASLWNKQAIAWPPYEERERIVGFLDTECARIDAVIEQTRASIEEYKKLKQSVITQAVTKGIRPGRKMKDSGVEWIGEIPENFTRRKLKTFSEIISKGTTPKEMETEFNDIYTVRYIKSENIVANRLQELPLFTITEQIHFGELQRSKLSDRDILFVIAGASIGKVAIMRKDMLPANTNQATCFIRINTQYLKYQKYIWYVLQADFIKTYIQLFAVQSAQPNLSMADLGDLFIPVPSEEDEVYHITEYLDSMCAHIDFLTNQKEQLLLDLESYKKSLIFEYVTGKKEVV